MPAISSQNAILPYGIGRLAKNAQNAARSWWKQKKEPNAQTKIANSKKIWQNKLSAAVLELEDRTDSKSVVPKGRVGSTPTRGTFINEPTKENADKGAGKNIAGPMETKKDSGYRN